MLGARPGYFRGYAILSTRPAFAETPSSTAFLIRKFNIHSSTARIFISKQFTVCPICSVFPTFLPASYSFSSQFWLPLGLVTGDYTLQGDF